MCAVLDTLSQSNGQRLLGPRRRGGVGVKGQGHDETQNNVGCVYTH